MAELLYCRTCTVYIPLFYPVCICYFQLRKSTFLHYGIPRVKNSSASPGSPGASRSHTLDPHTDQDPWTGNSSDPVVMRETRKTAQRESGSGWDPQSPRETIPRVSSWDSKQDSPVVRRKEPRSPRVSSPVRFTEEAYPGRENWAMRKPRASSPTRALSPTTFQSPMQRETKMRSPRESSPTRVHWVKEPTSPRDTMGLKSPRLNPTWDPKSPNYGHFSFQDVKSKLEHQTREPMLSNQTWQSQENLRGSQDYLSKSHQTLPGQAGKEPGLTRLLYSPDHSGRNQNRNPTYAQSAIVYAHDPPPDYEDRAEMLSEPAADYDRSHDNVLRSHDNTRRSRDNLLRSRDDLRQSRDDLNTSQDNLNEGGMGKRYRDSVNVTDLYNGKRKTIECEFYQPD